MADTDTTAAYPTSDAYEAACAALEKHRVRADKAEAELGQYRRAVAEVRALHFQYLTAWADEYTCAGCNRGMELVLWPCDTIKAIDEAVKP